MTGRIYAVLFSAAGFLAMEAAGAIEIEIFTSGQYPVTGLEAVKGPGIRVTAYDLDAPRRWERELGADLPGSPEAAKAEMMARFKRIGMEEVERSLREAYAGQTKAFRYGIVRYPAIVFDSGAAVVYGADLIEALDRYRHWREAR